MEIQPVTSDDISLLAEMNHQLIKDEGHRNRMSVPELRERMAAWLTNEYFAVLIRENSNLAGYALWRVEKDYIYIRQFFILPEFRGRGAGKKAVQLLKKQYWQGVTLRLDVLVNNLRGKSFWHTVGFSDYCTTMECKNTS